MGDGQVEEVEADEAFELPIRGLRNNQGARVWPRKLCNPTYVSRLSTMRFNKTVKKFSDIQLGYISKYKMDALLHMPYHLKIPMNMLEWLDQHVFGTREPCFKHKDKVIKITKDMVDKIFDFPGGTVPFVFSSDDPQVKEEVAELRNKYLDHRNKMPINRIEQVMLSDESEDGFMRSFTFYFISSILCPASYCFGNTKFLFSLRDVSAIPSLDFGQLALDFMREESERHFEMIMNRDTVEEMNKPSHIGGCLPIWGIIYLDFVDFDVIENHQSTVDYSLPRISHIKNEDFEYLALVDRNYESRKAFGVLPLRHISQTPYANTVPMNNAPDAPPVFPPAPEVEVNLDNNLPETLNENTPINSNSPSRNLGGPNAIPKDEIDVKVKAEPHLKSEIPDGEVVNQEPIGPKVETPSNFVYGTPTIPIRATNLNTNPIQQATTSQPKEEEKPSTQTAAKFFSNGVNAKRSFILISSSSSKGGEKQFQGTPILIQDDSPFSAAAATSEEIPNSDPVASVGIQTPMDFPDQPGSSRFNDAGAGSSTGPNTIEKKNRKKRAAKPHSPDAPKKLKIAQEVDLFFTKFLRKPIFNEYTLFVDIEGFPISYENFYNSFKARGEIGDEVMNSLIQTINFESKRMSDIKPFIKKFCFTSYFTNKLLVSPESFDPISCVREFDKINSEESLWKQDLLFFPSIKSNHWVLICISSLFERTHFFDPCATIQEFAQEEIIHNLLSNYNMLCKLSKKPFKNVFSFKLQATAPYPTNCLMHDSGHYLPLYMENFEGKAMKSFSAENVPKYRMISAVKLFKSSMNKLKEDDLPLAN